MSVLRENYSPFQLFRHKQLLDVEVSTRCPWIVIVNWLHSTNKHLHCLERVKEISLWFVNRSGCDLQLLVCSAFCPRNQWHLHIGIWDLFICCCCCFSWVFFFFWGGHTHFVPILAKSLIHAWMPTSPENLTQHSFLADAPKIVYILLSLYWARGTWWDPTRHTRKNILTSKKKKISPESLPEFCLNIAQASTKFCPDTLAIIFFFLGGGGPQCPYPPPPSPSHMPMHLHLVKIYHPV